ncbi:MAG: FecR domain-containing protein [Dechloromonas sp.]|uniref:FecR domain-containing protein n=1 Tax=Candidatus Dechloromonas phosphorivorans TaxID=2899244 RepID=A0A935K3N2_9RHOO|nr:FecR domain-containing protein [Candidatus Dechloromonas phosphorivorans]
MSKVYRTVLCTVISLALAGSAWANEAAGTIKTSKGQVNIERAGEKVPAVVGSPVYVSDKVRSGADGSFGVTLKDNTLLSGGPNSLVVINKFSYDTTTNAGGMSIGVRKGTLAVATGKIAKATPESIDFLTPTSVLGVRGTEFVVEVGEGSDE